MRKKEKRKRKREKESERKGRETIKLHTERTPFL